MTILLKKPILVIGVSLSVLLWLWQSFESHLNSIEDYSIWILIIISGSFWLWKPKNKIDDSAKIIFSNITEAKFNSIIQDTEKLINNWEIEIKTLKSKKSLEENQALIIAENKTNYLNQLAQIKEYYLDKNNYLNIALVSHNKFSAYSLEKILTESNQLNFNSLNLTIIDNLFKAIAENEEIRAIAEQNSIKENLLLNYDLVLFIIHGDLTESEKQILINATQQQQKTLLLFNKIDYNSPEEQNLIFNQLKQRISNLSITENLLTISTNPQTIKVKKYQDSENYQEWEEKINPDCDNLISQLNAIINQETPQLRLNTAYRKAINFKQAIKNQLNLVRKEKAIPLIEKYQIIAASATFANPVASLDLLATVAINTQMIVDLGNIYQQKLSLNQAQNVATELAKLMVKLGIVELSSQTITTILKSNAVTFVAGGIIQGVSTAYLTRVCGLSLIDYFANTEINLTENQFNLEQLKTKLQSVFNEYQQKNILTQFVQKTAVKLAIQE